MPYATITNRGAKKVRNGHLWCYRGDIRRIDAVGGDVVTVVDEAKNFVGKAFYSDSSEIALRFFTTKDEEITEEFWFKKISNAIKLRNSLFDSLRGRDGEESRDIEVCTNALRLVNAEGDLLPSLIADFYDGAIVIQTLSQGTEKLKHLFADILREILSAELVLERNDSKVRSIENLPLQKSVIFGKLSSDERIIKQNGIKFIVSLMEGQKTGAFLDQRENYLSARRFAKGIVLDCFTFAGGFALNLAKNCDQVIAVDISDKAINLANRNAELNQISNVSFQVGNVFDFLREQEKAGKRYDVVILDPPAFAKSRQSLKGAIAGYKEINLRAMKILNHNGILITCSCSHHFTEELFLETLIMASRDAKRRVHLIEKRFQSSDHPILLPMPETLYLKCLIVRVFE